VIGVLTFLLYKPVQKMLRERSERIEEAQKAAEATIAEKRNIDEIVKKTIKKAETEAASLIEEATQVAAQRKKQLLAEAKTTVEAEVTKMRQDWEDDKSAMLDDIKREFSSAVFTTVEKVVGSLDKKTHQQLVDAELKTLLKRI
jgi:F-type H+-transporting ATPase subunit b